MTDRKDSTTDYNRRYADTEIIILKENSRYIKENVEDIQRQMKMMNEKLHSMEIIMTKTIDSKVEKVDCGNAMREMERCFQKLNNTVLKNSIIIGAGLAILALVIKAFLTKII